MKATGSRSLWMVAIVGALMMLFRALSVSASWAYQLPDSGQTKCYGDSGVILCPQSGQPFYGQDAQYRGAQPAYRDNGDGTVTDLNTGLIWQQADDQNDSSWWPDQALDYCAALDLAGQSDWRLPTRRELLSIGIDNGDPPHIDTEYFPQCRPGNYLSSTTYAPDPFYTWYVSFGRDGNSYVRCVRGDSPRANRVDNHDGTVSDTLGD